MCVLLRSLYRARQGLLNISTLNTHITGKELMKLPKTYDPHAYEDDIYALWEKSHAFAPKQRTGNDTFSVVVPPPNANGDLHLGHGLTLAIEDIMIRYHRMRGDKSLFLPGADHAGFETQVVYEKQLAKEGKSRFDFSREELYDRIWSFVAQNKSNYESQFRRLGASVDWDSYTYTLDPKIIAQAHSTFKQMWDEGLIYRGERLVNYCTFHRTGFADIEVKYEDATTPLYYMQYGPFELATTRPETKFGDTAVAIHPDDTRYAQYVGKRLTVEGVEGPFEIDVIADEMVDRNFGTGVVKITPAHDQNDWDVAQRHNLPAVRVINHDGTMNERAGRFRGMTVMEARKAVAEALDKKGLLIKVDKKYKNRVGTCYKCGTIIEPMLMKQWFIDMQPLAKPAIQALNDKQIEFYPSSKRQQLLNYLENLRDWNISRQITWGIPIPAFQNVDDEDEWIYDARVDQETIEVHGKTYRRDPDVFDTWFSSSSWPYATLDYPDGQEFKDYYPLNVMETGTDLLYPWVSRMVMMGLYTTGKVPFKSVYMHGMIQDEQGKKMSKSKGNVINPMELIEAYGSDSFRMGIISDETAGANRPYDPGKLVGARNFCNKLWNIARYIEDKIGDEFHLRSTPVAHTDADAWLLSKLQQSITDVARLYEANKFSEAAEYIYHLVWDDLADWYIEASKIQPNAGILGYALETVLKLAHPLVPFVTETIWQTLAWEKGSLLITSAWPTVLDATFTEEAERFEQLKTVVSEIRFIQSSLGVSKSKLVFSNSPVVAAHEKLIESLAKLGSVERGALTSGIKLTSCEAWLDLDEQTIKTYVDKLQTQIEQQQAQIGNLQKRLSNKSYVAHAPKELVEETRQQLADIERTIATLQDTRKQFSN